jgi:phosphate transport system permease protein
MATLRDTRPNDLKAWLASGAPWIWLNAGAVAICIIMVVGLIGLIAVRGLEHFWPADVLELRYAEGGSEVRLIGERRSMEQVTAARLRDAGVEGLPAEAEDVGRWLMRVGNREVYGGDFRYVLEPMVRSVGAPADLVAIERREWGNQYGYLRAVRQEGVLVAEGAAAWPEFLARIERVNAIAADMRELQKGELGTVNHSLERLRLRERRLQIDGELTPAAQETLAAERAAAQAEFAVLAQQLNELNRAMDRDTYLFEVQDGQVLEKKLALVVSAWRPNELGVGGKLALYMERLWGFVSDEPREANTEGGIFPAIFGTVMMTMLMSIAVVPFGVLAAFYLREYAKQGLFVRGVRIAVNNLAGVPSIVFGVFGLGFFVYFVGGSIDRIFYPELLPTPTYGTGGILWASLTLALLTVPVVIVATEESIASVPRGAKEGSLALGASKFQTICRVVLPASVPGILTGLILAMARGAGEVAPLMITGVVKLAPNLPLDGQFPFMHFDRKFMHLGFHIYDVGFQSPNVEAAKPMVFTTTLLLLFVVIALNLAAIMIRDRLRKKFRTGAFA